MPVSWSTIGPVTRKATMHSSSIVATAVATLEGVAKTAARSPHRAASWPQTSSMYPAGYRELLKANARIRSCGVVVLEASYTAAEVDSCCLLAANISMYRGG